MIERQIESLILKRLTTKKVIVVIGPRQVGKTTLIKKICSKKGNFLFLNGDDPAVHEQLNNAGEKQLRFIIGKNKLVFIDEAQQIPNIGRIAKLIHDQINDVRLIISGSSALELSNQLNESLTGRKWEHLLLPISWKEFTAYSGYLDANLQLKTRLIFGMYPEVITAQENAQEVLQQISGSYLYKDVLQLSGIRKPELLQKLLIALALQIGSEVNYNELANTLRIDRKTIENYIDLLEKVFVIFKLNPFSRNLRNELSSGRKIYFYDNGIRNAILGNFNSVELRNDIGQLWENFVISEKIKRNNYSGKTVHQYYWRSYQQQEIDLVEESGGELSATEFKWNMAKKTKFPTTFTDAYHPTELNIIDTKNFNDFLL